MRVTCAAVGGLGVSGVVENGFGAEYEGTWWLASRHSRVGHVGAVVGREGRVVVTKERVEDGEARGWSGAGESREGGERVQWRIDMRER